MVTETLMSIQWRRKPLSDRLMASPLKHVSRAAWGINDSVERVVRVGAYTRSDGTRVKRHVRHLVALIVGIVIGVLATTAYAQENLPCEKGQVFCTKTNTEAERRAILESIRNFKPKSDSARNHYDQYIVPWLAQVDGTETGYRYLVVDRPEEAGAQIGLKQTFVSPAATFLEIPHLLADFSHLFGHIIAVAPSQPSSILL